MAKQTFTTGQVLTAAQMTSLQQTAMGGGSATAKTASYVLVAADAGTTVIMNAAGATTITVNTSLFAAGDTVFILNQGAGVCTITAGTATVSTAGSLALSQNETGELYFLSTSASIFSDYTQASGGGGKVLQVVQATTTTSTSVASTSYTDTGLSLSITPTLNTSKVLILVNQRYRMDRSNDAVNASVQTLRGATAVYLQEFGPQLYLAGSTGMALAGYHNANYLDSPSTTSATTYKTQGKLSSTANSAVIVFQENTTTSSIILMEIGA